MGRTGSNGLRKSFDSSVNPLTVDLCDIVRRRMNQQNGCGIYWPESIRAKPITLAAGTGMVPGCCRSFAYAGLEKL